MAAWYSLDIADSTGDGFSYEILPSNTANKVHKHRNPVTFIRNVVRSWLLDLSHAPKCVKTQPDFKFYNRSGDELFGTEENKQTPYSLNPIYTCS